MTIEHERRKQIVSSFEAAIQDAKERGDMDDIDRIQREFLSFKADEARQKDDMLQLALLAVTDEASRANLHAAEAVTLMLLAFYEGGGREAFDSACGTISGSLQARLVKWLSLSGVATNAKG